MAVDMTKSSVTADQIAEARDWIADAYPANPLDMSDTHPVYELSAERVQRMTDRRYPGGWSAFVAECCEAGEMDIETYSEDGILWNTGDRVRYSRDRADLEQDGLTGRIVRISQDESGVTLHVRWSGADITDTHGVTDLEHV